MKGFTFVFGLRLLELTALFGVGKIDKICEIVFIIRDGEFAFDVNERTADKIVAFMKE